MRQHRASRVACPRPMSPFASDECATRTGGVGEYNDEEYENEMRRETSACNAQGGAGGEEAAL